MKTYLHAAALIFSAGAGFADPVEGVRPVLAILGIAALSNALAYLLFFRLLASAGATNLSLVTFLISGQCHWSGGAVPRGKFAAAAHRGVWLDLSGFAGD